MSSTKRALRTKPEGFQETESLVKQFIESEGKNYFEWLHEQHKEFIVQYTLKNMK